MLNNFSINNFKIFEGEHWFSFKDLNVFTGANNSGKSSFIQALKLFAEGFKNSDFPTLDLMAGTENLGGFDNVLNYNSDDNKFGFGFKIQIANINSEFDAKYLFIKGFEEEDKEKAAFHSFEIKDNNEVILGIYNHYHVEDDVFKSIHDNRDSMSMLIGKINIRFLKQHIDKISINKFDEILEFFDNKHNEFWWFEVLEEYNYDKTPREDKISDKRFKDVLHELKKDAYLNLAENEMKEDISDGDDEDIRKFEYDKYLIIINRYDFHDFIDSVVMKIMNPVIKHIETYVKIFSESNMIQIKPTDKYQNRLIPFNDKILCKIEKLQNQNESKFDKFIKESFGVFFEDSKNSIIKEKGIRIERQSTSGYAVILEADRKINIADLGKGTNNLLMLILKIASLVIVYDKTKKLILIEEPETFLHPAWQSKLADFFVYCMKEYDVQFFIETHSEYLIRKLQYLTTKQKIKPEDSVIYYFHHPDNIPKGEEQVKKLEIWEDGSLSGDFGPGFFDEATNLKFELLKLKNPQKN